ncbi:MAG: DNA cytosine methyltransferase [Acidobacteriaceae bacterium]
MQIPSPSKPLTSVDLFCGAGGITEGFREAGFACLYGNDINSHAIQTFAANHPEAIADNQPIDGVNPLQLRRKLGLRRGELTALVGGPPCQGFSINAPERFIEDPRNALFKHYLDFLDEFQPKTLLFENVPGMLSFAEGRIFSQIMEEIAKRGYQLSAQILFAAHYGVPQERWRLIIMGASVGNAPAHPLPTHAATGRANFRGGNSMTFKIPPFDRHFLKPMVTVQEALGDLPQLRMGEGAEEQAYTAEPHSAYARAMREGSSTVYNHYAARLAPQNVERLKHLRPGGSWRDLPIELLPKGMRLARRSDHTKRYGRLRGDGLAGTVMTKCDPHWGSVFLPDQDRSLTVREAARIQSFPDRYRFYGPRVAQYEQVGNAVPVLMAKSLAETLADHIEASNRQVEGLECLSA